MTNMQPCALINIEAAVSLVEVDASLAVAHADSGAYDQPLDGSTVWVDTAIRMGPQPKRSSVNKGQTHVEYRPSADIREASRKATIYAGVHEEGHVEPRVALDMGRKRPLARFGRTMTGRRLKFATVDDSRREADGLSRECIE